MKKNYFLLLILISIAFWYGEKRSFYCLKNGFCITVWKTYGNKCYIIPSKYYGILTPKEGYIKTSNLDDIDLIFINDFKNIIVAGNTSQIVNMINPKIQIEKYELKRDYYDKLFTYFDKGYLKYKNEIIFISINIREDYATDKTGNKL